MLDKILNFLIPSLIGLLLAALYAIFESYILQSISASVTTNQPSNILRILLLIPTVAALVLTYFLRKTILQNKSLKQSDHTSTLKKAEALSFRNEFGAYWDSKFNMYCLNCLQPLKKSTFGPKIFFCSNQLRCNSKHILRDDNGNELTKQQAIDLMTKKVT